MGLWFTGDKALVNMSDVINHKASFLLIVIKFITDLLTIKSPVATIIPSKPGQIMEVIAPRHQPILRSLWSGTSQSGHFFCRHRTTMTSKSDDHDTDGYFMLREPGRE